MKIILSPQVTVMAVKNSILCKPSLLSYQQLGDTCIITDVLVKKPLTLHHPDTFITLFRIQAEGDHFEHLL
jgi:hypothetical protein